MGVFDGLFIYSTSPNFDFSHTSRFTMQTVRICPPIGILRNPLTVPTEGPLHCILVSVALTAPLVKQRRDVVLVATPLTKYLHI